MESLRLDEESIIKDMRNPFRLKKELSYTANKDIRIFFFWLKDIKDIKEYLRY